MRKRIISVLFLHTSDWVSWIPYPKIDKFSYFITFSPSMTLFSKSPYLTILTLGARTVFFVWKKHSKFRCTGLLRSSNLVHVDGKNSTCFIQNLMNLILSSKSNRKWPKMAKTKTVQKTTYMWHSESKG